MFKVNNKVTRTTPLAGIFIVNFEHISHLALVSLLLTLSMQLPAGKGDHLLTTNAKSSKK